MMKGGTASLDAKYFHHNCRGEVAEHHRQHEDAQGAANHAAQQAVNLS